MLPPSLFERLVAGSACEQCRTRQGQGRANDQEGTYEVRKVQRSKASRVRPLDSMKLRIRLMAASR